MRIVSLNTWGATQGDVFFTFIQEQSKITDIFCLQEVFFSPVEVPVTDSGGNMQMLQKLQVMLPEFYSYYQARSSGYDFSDTKANVPVNFGIATFVRKGLTVKSYAGVQLLDRTDAPDIEPIEGAVVAQVSKIQAADSSLRIINFHGMSRPGHKNDTDPRILQSKSLLDLIRSFPGESIVLCGDFNLNPDTYSIQLLESELRNLIAEYGVTNTRNEISWKKYPDNKQHFADFTFVSRDINVSSFEVPYNEVSDHLPMILELEL